MRQLIRHRVLICTPCNHRRCFGRHDGQGEKGGASKSGPWRGGGEMGVGSDFTKGAQYSRNEMITARNQVSREIQPGPRRVENNRLDISNQEFRFKWSRKRRSLGFRIPKGFRFGYLYSRLVHARLSPSRRPPRKDS